MHRRATYLASAAALALILAGCGDNDDGKEAGDCSPAESEITVTAFDKLRFDADSYQASAGCVGVTYTNDGSVAHTLLVKGQSGFKLSIGDSDEGAIDLDPGTYTLYCDVPGHEAAGMEAGLTVE
ncbi:MAG TPA: plastocyanin/azurin family copper-binding protein [Acidimicrobiales bacterium]|nr:plastocyanin/azurin family copper-binding protein [Acidimicrobiales bacterium]